MSAEWRTGGFEFRAEGARVWQEFQEVDRYDTLVRTGLYVQGSYRIGSGEPVVRWGRLQDATVDAGTVQEGHNEVALGIAYWIDPTLPVKVAWEFHEEHIMCTKSTIGWALALALLLPTAAASQQDPALLGEGAEVYSTTCVRCHSARSGTERTDREWVAIVAHMRARAKLTRSKAAAVLASCRRPTFRSLGSRRRLSRQLRLPRPGRRRGARPSRLRLRRSGRGGTDEGAGPPGGRAAVRRLGRADGSGTPGGRDARHGRERRDALQDRGPLLRVSRGGRQGDPRRRGESHGRRVVPRGRHL